MTRTSRSLTRTAAIAALALGLTACGFTPFGSLAPDVQPAVRQPARAAGAESVAVNRYLWTAALDTLSFLPIQSVDPFTGVIVTGYGTPPGGSTAYRATVHISDPALDARALNVALATRSGPVPVETQRAVEDAILSRARELRIRDGGL